MESVTFTDSTWENLEMVLLFNIRNLLTSPISGANKRGKGERKNKKSDIEEEAEC